MRPWISTQVDTCRLSILHGTNIENLPLPHPYRQYHKQNHHIIQIRDTLLQMAIHKHNIRRMTLHEHSRPSHSSQRQPYHNLLYPT